MKKKLIALLLASAMALGTGVILAGCNTTPAEPEHTTHYDVNADGKCDKCNEDMPDHTHIFSKKWDSDATHHWHKATCAHGDETSGKAEHEFDSMGICGICKVYDTEPVAPIDGVYHFEAEVAKLDDKEAPSNSTMVVELNKHEFTESDKEDGALVSNIGYFGGGAQGQTITWTFTANAEAKGVKLTLRLASAVGSWGDRKITEIDLGSEGAPTLTVNDAAVSLEGKTLTGLDGLTQNDMQNGVAYHNFCNVEITIDIKAGENNIVLTSGSKGCNVDKIMIETNAELVFARTNNSSRPASH